VPSCWNSRYCWKFISRCGNWNSHFIMSQFFLQTRKVHKRFPIMKHKKCSRGVTDCFWRDINSQFPTCTVCADSPIHRLQILPHPLILLYPTSVSHHPSAVWCDLRTGSVVHYHSSSLHAVNDTCKNSSLICTYRYAMLTTFHV